MAQSLACHTLFQNFSFGGKNKLAGIALTESNNTFVMSHGSTPAVAQIVASAIFPTIAPSFLA